MVIVSNRVGEPDLKNRRTKMLAKTRLGKGSCDEKREREEQPLRGSDRVWREDVDSRNNTVKKSKCSLVQKRRGLAAAWRSVSKTTQWREGSSL